MSVIIRPTTHAHCQDVEGNTALHMAVVSHRSEAVRILLEAGADPTIPNRGHFTPILEAARNGFYAYVTTHRLKTTVFKH